MMMEEEDHHHHQAAAAAQRYLCKFCNKSFVSGKSLGGHMRGHLALISAQKHEAITDGESGFESLSKISKKGSTVSEPPPPPHEEKVNESQMLGFEEEDGGGTGQAGSYGLRENPKKSWRVSSDPKRVALNLKGENFCKECGKGFSSLRALSGHMRSHSMKGKDKEKNLILNCCKKCGKGFESLRAMYGHMRSHSKKSKLSGDQSEDDDVEIKPQPEPPTGELVNPIRKKRSRTRYKIAGPSDPSAGSSSNLNSSFSTMTVDVEVEEVAMCLIMLSRGVRNWDEFNSGIGEFDSVYSRNVDFGVEFDVSAVDDDESFEGLKFKNQSELAMEKGWMMAEVVDFGGQAGASKKLKSNGQDFVSTIGGASCDEEIFDAEIDVGLKRNNNKVEHECSICFKVFGSGQALGGHKRAHYNGTIIESSSSSKATESELLEQEFAEIHKLLNLNLSVNLEDGVKGDHNAGGLKPWWVGNDLEREPLVIL